MEEKQQPDMTDLFQPGDRRRVVERRQQLQYPARRRGQLRLTRDGELLLEAGVDDTDGTDAVLNGVGSLGNPAMLTDWQGRGSETGQRLLQVGQQVARVFQTDMQAQQVTALPA